jgi:hypothetical protein
MSEFKKRRQFRANDAGPLPPPPYVKSSEHRMHVISIRLRLFSRRHRSRMVVDARAIGVACALWCEEMARLSRSTDRSNSIQRSTRIASSPFHTDRTLFDIDRTHACETLVTTHVSASDDATSPHRRRAHSIDLESHSNHQPIRPLLGHTIEQHHHCTSPHRPARISSLVVRLAS